MKKVKYLITICVCIAVLSFGVVALANGGTTSDTSKDLKHEVDEVVNGTFVAMVEGDRNIKVDIDHVIENYPLATSFLVSRDHKKAALDNLVSGDHVKLVLNASKQVTYIKAYSEAYIKPEVAAAKVLPTTPVPAPTVAPEATVEPTATVTPKEDKKISMVKADSKVKTDKDKKDCDDNNKFGDDDHDDKKSDGWNNHDDRNKQDGWKKHRNNGGRD